MQILYLQQFCGTNWFLVCKDTFELFTIYDAVFFEPTYHAQSQPFNLVNLYADLQEYLQERVSGPAQQVIHNLVSRPPPSTKIFPIACFWCKTTIKFMKISLK